MFKDIKKLPPGYILSLKDNKLDLKEYWELNFQIDDAGEEYYSKRLYELLRESVKRRLMSDVPLGTFLSGGIDSSSVVAFMSQLMDRPVKTFSIGFDDPTYNELKYARLVAKHFQTEHHDLIIKPDVMNRVEKLIRHLDEPLGDFSIFPTYLVSELAHKYVKVVLSGDGGDELFAGYDTYKAERIYSFYRRLPRLVREKIVASILGYIPPSPNKKGLLNKAKRFVEGAILPAELYHTRWMIFFTEKEKENLYSPELGSLFSNGASYDFIKKYFQQAGIDDTLGKQLYVDIKTYLVDDILVKVDRMSMATSIEARVPFLDHELVEFVGTIPNNLKLKGSVSKYILKKTMSSLLPPETISRGKEGFSIPIKNWLKGELRPLMLDTLSFTKIKQENLFNWEYIDTLVKQHLEGRANHSHILWALMVFELWRGHYGGNII